jgi:hypothetical protein
MTSRVFPASAAAVLLLSAVTWAPASAQTAPTKPDTVFVGLNDRDPAWHDLYKVRISTGERTLIARNTERVTAFVFDLKDYLRLVTRAPASGGQTRPFTVDLGGELFNDAAGICQTIATLPFEPGYRIAFRTFDVQVQRIRIVQLQMLGIESVTAPAGTYDTFKIELSTADDGAKTTVWVVKDSRKVAKIVGVRPQLQGATLTSELLN